LRIAGREEHCRIHCKQRIQSSEVASTDSNVQQFQGFCNFCRAELGIDPILCKQHATGKTLSCICLLCLFLILWPAGTAALQYSHVKYFPNQDVYSEYYDFVVYICDIGAESFAARAQTMLVDHLRKHFGNGVAILFRQLLVQAYAALRVVVHAGSARA
jgi:hypothetical protein